MNNRYEREKLKAYMVSAGMRPAIAERFLQLRDERIAKEKLEKKFKAKGFTGKSPEKIFEFNYSFKRKLALARKLDKLCTRKCAKCGNLPESWFVSRLKAAESIEDIIPLCTPCFKVETQHEKDEIEKANAS